MRLKSNEIKSTFLYLAIYWPMGTLFPLLGQYLNQLGFSGTQIGSITSAGTASAVVFGMVWAKFYANTEKKRRFICIMFLCTACLGMTSLTVKVFVLYLIVYVAMLAFQGPVHGMVDSLVMEGGERFPVVRAFGAIGYSIAAGVGGQLAKAHGLNFIFYLHALGFITAALIIMLKDEPAHTEKGRARKDKIAVENEKEGKISALECFKDKDFIQLLICAFFALGPTMGTNTYLGFLVTENGGDVSQIGNAFLLMAGSEAIIMILIPFVNKRIPSEKLVMIGLLAAVVRYSYYSTGPSVAMLYTTFMLQGIQNGIILIEIPRYFEKVVNPRLAAVSVATYYALGNNLSTIVCNFLGGVVLDVFNAKGVFVMYAAMSAAGLIFYMIFGLNRVKDRAFNN